MHASRRRPDASPCPCTASALLFFAVACSSPPAAEPDRLTLGPAAFEMGSDPAEVPSLMERYDVSRAGLFEGELPRRAVSLAAFEIDRTEVTNDAYAAFVAARPEWAPDGVAVAGYLRSWTDSEPPPGQELRPVAFVTWQAAAAFCEWAGGRLPSEAEWEFAARGGLSGEVFPWGDRLPAPDDANWSGAGLGRTTDVASYLPNGYGLHDMAGNVWEWTTDPWGDPGAEEPRRVIRGGSYGGAAVNLRVRYRDSHREADPVEHVGFRCARTVR